MPKKGKTKALTGQEKKFVKEVVKTGNKTQSVIKAFPDIEDENYAGVKGNRLIRKDKIKNAIQNVADSLPDKVLIKTHLQGLKAKQGKNIDYSVRHKYLDTAYKIKSYYPKESNQTAIQINFTEAREEFE